MNFSLLNDKRQINYLKISRSFRKKKTFTTDYNNKFGRNPEKDVFRFIENEKLRMSTVEICSEDLERTTTEIKSQISQKKIHQIQNKLRKFTNLCCPVTVPVELDETFTGGSGSVGAIEDEEPLADNVGASVTWFTLVI